MEKVSCDIEMGDARVSGRYLSRKVWQPSA
jgi:hypothetical protein